MKGVEKGGTLTRVDPPAADVVLVECAALRENVRGVMPEVEVVFGRSEDALSERERKCV